MEKWTRVLYQPNLPLGENGEKLTGSQKHIELSKEAAKEGMVLLKNNGGLLPLGKGTKAALFGKATFDYVKGGGGSGDVTVAYIRNLYEGLKLQKDKISIFEPLCDYYRKDVERQYAQGCVPGMTIEPAVPQELLVQARAFTDTAIISICRFSGEGWDRKSVIDEKNKNLWENERKMTELSARIFANGDFCLSIEEEKMVEAVKKSFPKVIVVMNVGGMVDTSWFAQDDAIGAVLMAWQGGMEGGLAAAELLTGNGNPSGKLADTFAKTLEDYPSTANFHESRDYVDYTEDIYVGYRYFETIPGAAKKVNYPFGFGLSYTTFAVKTVWAGEKGGSVQIQVNVTNTGKVPGKEVVQVYFGAPQGRLGKPKKQLIAFEKTRELKPGETQTVSLTFRVEEMASYDDLGKIQKSAYVLEKGDYIFYMGTSVRDAEQLDFVYTEAEDRVTKQLSSHLAPTSLAKRMLADGSFEELPQSEPNDPDANELEKMPSELTEGYAPAVRGRSGYQLWKEPYKKGVHILQEVAEGKITLDEFVAQLTDEEAAHLLGGQPNTGVANTFGYGNLPEYGVPSVMTADGPAGLRILEQCQVKTTCWPCSTLLACSWNPEIVEAVGTAGGEEVKENNIAVWLTPAVNIHRSPLCGRNFEYYSEDPFLAGKLASAMVRGIQSNHVGATVKHFALNNKESNRKNSDSRVSERAAREIYLKAFEIIVKEAKPWSIMTSYNIINGHRASENADLLEGILRGEWGFDGCVTTDWWTCGEHYKETKAGNDVKMGCGYPERLLEALAKGYLTREEMNACVKRVLGLILKVD
ncbi:MAG: glycoside hydrolase family 3 C-terminal domain-containing protein [Candidatus Limivivens sp.]|nr:glycoside hydrolase family 3 C-terminal domain-containing protein [Candidatus Limivivens sp.]